MIRSIPFVKGHCGWDVVTLIPADEVPETERLAASLKILDPPVCGGLEVGWLGRVSDHNEMPISMVSSTARNWIRMCGGMSQVIGKALVETFLGERLRIRSAEPELRFELLTPVGRIPVSVEVGGGRCRSVTTSMNAYLTYINREGIESLKSQGIPILKVGNYAVIEITELEAAYPGLDFTRRDLGESLIVVNELLRNFAAMRRLDSATGMLFDDRVEGGGHFRVFPRFHSADLSAARIPWEFQCGTGGIAVAVALAAKKRLPTRSGAEPLILEWGSQRTTPDPYGIRTSRLQLECEGTSVHKARFSHSVIEILEEGRLHLPSY